MPSSPSLTVRIKGEGVSMSSMNDGVREGERDMRKLLLVLQLPDCLCVWLPPVNSGKTA